MNQVNFSQFNLTQNNLKQEDLHQVILLDIASTVELACNPKLGDQVETSAIKMKLNTNIGSKIITERINISAYIKYGLMSKQLPTYLHSTIWQRSTALLTIIIRKMHS